MTCFLLGDSHAALCPCWRGPVGSKQALHRTRSLAPEKPLPARGMEEAPTLHLPSVLVMFQNM